MTRREQLILLAAVVVLVVGGAVTVKLRGSATLSEHGSGVHGAAKVANSALRRGLAYATTGATAASGAEAYGDWTCPKWSMASVGVDPLRPNHPLFRRPSYIGENRHKIMSEGWGGWYYNPPSEVYF
jgi:hypothetical protein